MAGSGTGPGSEPRPGPARLAAIDPDASPEEVAAIVAALGVVLASRGAEVGGEPEPGSRWVAASRLAAARGGLSRGEWRLSGRIGRRSRA